MVDLSKFTVGNIIVQRNGVKAEIIEVAPDKECEFFPFRIYYKPLKRNKQGVMGSTYTQDGYYLNSKTPNDRDIVSYIIRSTVCIGKDGYGEF